MPRANRHARQAAILRDAAERAGRRSILRGLEPSWAQRQQGEVNLRDLILADTARMGRPGVRWWWGERTGPEGRGAWCYLCDAQIIGYDTAHAITRAAQAAIIEHRDRLHAAAVTP